MRKLPTVQRRGRGPVVFEEAYDFEKAGGLARKPEVAGLSGKFSTVKPEIGRAKFQFASSVTVRMNNDLGNLGGPDPMVAVGEKTVLVANTTSFKFFDKATGQVTYANDVTNLFSMYLLPSSSQWLNNFYNVPWDVPYYCSKDTPCNKAGVSVKHDPNTGLRLPCEEKTDEGTARDAYDMRVIYQKEHRRFVIVAALKNNTSRDNNYYNPSGSRDCSQYLLRLVGIAVSVSENPADGFHFYRTEENNYRDWPNVVVDQDYLVIAHKGGGQFSEGTSIVSVYPFRQMMVGTQNVEGFFIKQITPMGVSPKAVIPVTNLETDHKSQAFFFIEHANGDQGQIKIWYIKKPSDPATIFNNPPTQLREAGGQLIVAGANFTGGYYAGVTYFKDQIYMVSHQLFFESSSLFRKGYGLNVFRIPVHSLNSGGYEPTTVGLERQVFKHENYSYLFPSIAVDVFRNLAIQFVRIPRDKHASEKPQIRTKVKFSQDTDWRDSQLVKEWTVEHDGSKLVHYSWIVKDPFNIAHFWHAHRLTTGTKGMWVGRIDLNAVPAP